ncbi:MAG TPA: DUF6263 family protein [Gemmatimonadota bacterium]|nr:DUF6263 family protein [Gemmatimonadota bacterium]
MNRIAALFLIPALVSACGDRGVPSEVRLRLEYEEGDTLLYEYRTEGMVTMPDTSEPSGRKTQPYQRHLIVEEAVRDVTPSGNYVLVWTFHLRADSLAGEKSEDLPDSVQLTVQITPQGRVLSVGGVETARPLFGEIDFQSYFEQSQPVFPERPLKVGDSWTQEVRVVSPRSEPVTTSSTYVLESVMEEDGEPVAVIAFDGDIYLPFLSRPAEADSLAAAATTEERIRVTGEMYFALESGKVRRAESEADATLTKVEIIDGEPVRREVKIQETTRYEVTNP